MVMREALKFYIDGKWVDAAEPRVVDVENPATQQACGQVALGSAADVDKAVIAARRAFASSSASTIAERISLLEEIGAQFTRRRSDLAHALTAEMGAPASLANGFQTDLLAGHLTTAIEVLRGFQFREQRGSTLIVREPIGVCGLITPWNWPLSLIAVKLFPAIATGCTMVLKPSEQAPFSAQILAEILDAAGVPAGVFNLVHGDGAGVGAAISAHPDIDMVSFTGSTRAGIEVARAAAPTVKRVSQELGGKSANILLDDADLANAVKRGVMSMMMNSGQTCSAPSRMLVPAPRMAEAIAAAAEAADGVTVGDPTGNHMIGPVASAAQFQKVQQLIQLGVDEGATLAAGGLGRPEGLSHGYFVKPTIFAHVKPEMAIAREEIFGPVLSILGYDSVDHAVAIANDTDYGLAGFVSGEDGQAALDVALRLRAGSISINDGFDFLAPFGGYGKSGNGREWGEFGFHEFLEIKAIAGFSAA